MTGGESRAQVINQDLAWLAESCGLGMGLGSCRVYLESENRQADFMVRAEAPSTVIMANLGIAQVQKYLEEESFDRVEQMLETLGCDGLMVHINPLQEWFQKEGDRFSQTPLETLIRLKKHFRGPIGVKEVGQGFGPKSLKALIDLRVDVIELAGLGGTNFTKLESLRVTEDSMSDEFTHLGHSYKEMIPWLNELYKSRDGEAFPHIIVSGGVRTPGDAAWIYQHSLFDVVIGMGYPFLKWQIEGRENLKKEYLKFYTNWMLMLKCTHPKVNI